MFSPSTIMGIAMKSNKAEKLYYNVDTSEVTILKSGEEFATTAPQNLINILKNNEFDLRVEYNSHKGNTRNKPVQIYDNMIEIALI